MCQSLSQALINGTTTGEGDSNNGFSSKGINFSPKKGIKKLGAILDSNKKWDGD